MWSGPGVVAILIHLLDFFCLFKLDKVYEINEKVSQLFGEGIICLVL